MEVCSYLTSLKGIDLNIKDEEHKTPLHFACGEGHTSVVGHLISLKGLDINSKDVLGVFLLFIRRLFIMQQS